MRTVRHPCGTRCGRAGTALAARPRRRRARARRRRAPRSRLPRAAGRSRAPARRPPRPERRGCRGLRAGSPRAPAALTVGPTYGRPTAAGGRAPDDAGDRDQRQCVREPLEQRPPLRAVGRQPVGDRAREAEEHRGAPRAEGRQFPKMSAARPIKPADGHLLAEGVDEADREVRAAERGDHARERDGDVAHACRPRSRPCRPRAGARHRRAAGARTACGRR